MLKSTKRAVTLSLLLSLGSIGAWAQSGTLTSGGNGKGSGGTVSYSVGLTGYETSSAKAGSNAAGLQHAHVSVITGVNRPEINLVAEVYPNPTVNQVTLKVKNIALDDLNYVLLDISGNELQHQAVNSSSTSVYLTNLADSTFLLRVFNKKQEIKTFKIVKNS